jgi:hypothetical protein
MLGRYMYILPLHDENVDDDIDQIEQIAEDKLECPVAVAPVVIWSNKRRLQFQITVHMKLLRKASFLHNCGRKKCFSEHDSKQVKIKGLQFLSDDGITSLAHLFSKYVLKNLYKFISKCWQMYGDFGKKIKAHKKFNFTDMQNCFN